MNISNIKDKIAMRYKENKTSAMNEASSLVNIPDDLINMSIGDPDINTHIDIIEAAMEDAKNGHTHYSDAYGYLELREEIASFYREEYQINITYENVMITTSANHAMWLTLECIIDDFDEVIIIEPYFTPYKAQVKLARGVAVTIPTYERDDFMPLIKELEKAVTKKTKAIIVNTPNNPSGACYDIETLENIYEFAKKHDIIIIADDIYTTFLFDLKFTPIAKFDKNLDRVITLNSLSKDYAMTGWRIGYIVADKNIIDTVKDINENNVFSAPSISQRAALYALQNRKYLNEEIVSEFKKRMDYAYQRILKLKNITVIKPKGSIYLFPNIKNTGLTSDEFSKQLFDKAHILVLPGNCFGDSGEGYIRMALTVGDDKLKEVFDRMETMDFIQK